MRRAISALRPLAKVWYRAEVRGVDKIPSGGALVVSNHSGGLIAMDIPVLAIDFYEHFGYDRPLYWLGHDMLLSTPFGEFLSRTGLIRADPENAQKALSSGGTVMVFPGGDYDVYRPSTAANVIDFGNRTGYVRTALEARVPIVPAVSIGGQENQLYLSRGQGLARRLGLRRLIRANVVPITFGIPFGFSALLPINLPLPTKIVTQVLEPIDIVAQFGEDPDIAAVDAHVRGVMQVALKQLAAARRLPVVG
ncbi:lysophospholipid acyltransferase family protein [Mycobacterium sp. UM_CSW]|uniref:lysophospholipid acyltransferase family protein n=1 Tax=Mycobacterium sp. UM_CSW TaxID=1370119 RepID=UPI00082EFF65|nr:lysophospholipid acyltransferase family protein [Mycobacterium sp. UM_CSW]